MSMPGLELMIFPSQCPEWLGFQICYQAPVTTQISTLLWCQIWAGCLRRAPSLKSLQAKCVRLGQGSQNWCCHGREIWASSQHHRSCRVLPVSWHATSHATRVSACRGPGMFTVLAFTTAGETQAFLRACMGPGSALPAGDLAV